MDCRGIETVLVAEFGGEIPFFRRYEHVVASDEGRQEQHEHLEEIECQRNPSQNSNAAEVERIS
jgi:hypothetical protein